MAKNWIAGAIKKPGALHAALRVSPGQKIPASKMAVKDSDSPLMKKRKSLAKTLGKFRGKGGVGMPETGVSVDSPTEGGATYKDFKAKGE